MLTLVLIYNLISNSIKLAKVRLLLSLFCFSITSIITAQETKYGAKLGFNYSSIVGDLTEGLKFRFSGHGGIFVETEINQKFAIKSELLYSSQGFQFSSDLESIENNEMTLDQTDFRTNVQLNYLTLPVLGKFALSNVLYIEFGPQFGFLLNQVTKIRNLNQADNIVSDNRNTISGNFRLDYGAAAGLDIKINNKFSVAPRFYIGLRNRLNEFAGNLQNYNLAIQLSAAYLFL